MDPPLQSGPDGLVTKFNDAGKFLPTVTHELSERAAGREALHIALRLLGKPSAATYFVQIDIFAEIFKEVVDNRLRVIDSAPKPVNALPTQPTSPDPRRRADA